VRLNTEKPLLKGTLALSPLDLRPYMAAWSEQNPEGEILPWSKDQIILTSLNSMDAEVEISTPAILMDRLKLGPSESAVTLKNGTLTADLKKTELYGGDASGTFSIQSDNGTPALSMDARIKSVAAQDFFMASAGFEKVTGTSDVVLSFSGRGQSQDQIMKSLSGNGIFKVLNGQLMGLDAGALLSGVDTALTQRQLPEGLGLGKTTDFKDIDGKFSLNNGRATLTGFQLQSGSFFIDATGAVDIGEQTLDIGLHPKLTGGSDLAQFGIPLRFTGGFGSAKAGLDTSFLGDIAKAKARQKAGGAVRDNLGGTLGNILGGVIGGETPQTDASEDNDTATETGENVSPDTDSETKPNESETPEDQIESALKDLFGRKKKKPKDE